MTSTQSSGGGVPSEPTGAAAGTPTRADCIAAGMRTYVDGLLHAEQTLTPREQAEAAWHPGSRHTVDELEDRIRLARGLPALRQRTA